jgi:hypothetical protein
MCRGSHLHSVPQALQQVPEEVAEVEEAAERAVQLHAQTK